MAARRRGERRGPWVALALVVGLLLAPATVGAEPVSGSQLRTLAEQAGRGDSAARERLDRVTAVDGRPVALRDALDDAEGPALRERLRQIAAQAAPGAAPARPDAGARTDAEDVLDQRRYTGTDVPRPFAGPLEWIGDRLDPIVDWVDDRIDSIPGPSDLAYLVLALLLLGAVALLGTRVLRRRDTRAAQARARGAHAAGDDPAALEREADAAERAGDWERAVRLRFRAGLLRLDEAERLAYRPSLTTGDAARTLHSPAFDDLGRRFDAIAYGGAPADAEDANTQRDAWRRVLDEGPTALADRPAAEPNRGGPAAGTADQATPNATAPAPSDPPEDTATRP